jgi:hypothetical protein|nr:MAG TPA: lipoprotein [Caudoviricetes sp.]
MKSSIIKTGTMLAGFLLAACLSTHAEVKLPAIFSDGMVMQQLPPAEHFVIKVREIRNNQTCYLLVS